MYIGSTEFGVEFDFDEYMHSPNGYSLANDILETGVNAGYDMVEYSITTGTRPNNIGVGTYRDMVSQQLLTISKQGAVMDKFFGYTGAIATGYDVANSLYTNAVENTDVVGAMTDNFVDLSMTWASATASAAIGAQTGAWIGSLIPVPGVGTAVGAAAGLLAGTVLYVATEAITINGKSIKEHVKSSFDNVVADIKSWFS